MHSRRLGQSTIDVTEIGYGTMSLPNNEKIATDILQTAFHHGIRFFDTADLYGFGKNETLLAPFLKEHRRDIVLATKVGNELLQDGSWRWNPTKAYIIEAVKSSLQKMGTDYIDLYQLHGGTMEDNVEETIDAFNTLKKEGIILEYGISSIRPTVIDRFLRNSNAISVMMQYGPLDRRPEEWFPLIDQYGASVITRGTLAKGLLTNHLTSQEKVEKGFARYQPEELKKVWQSIQEIPNIHATTLQYVLQDKTISSVVLGASTKEQLIESVAAYNTPVADEHIQLLQNITKKHLYDEHRI